MEEKKEMFQSTVEKLAKAIVENLLASAGKETEQERITKSMEESANRLLSLPSTIPAKSILDKTEYIPGKKIESASREPVKAWQP